MKDDLRLLVCAVIILIILTAASVCSSKKIEVTATGQYLISKNEKISDGEEYAYKEALRAAIEKVAVRVVSYTKTINNVLEEDIVETFASSIVKIKNKQVQPVIEGENIVIKVIIAAIVDTDDIAKWVPPDIEKQRQLESDNKELKEQIAREKRERLISTIGTAGGGNNELAAAALEKAQPLINARQYIEADKVLTGVIKGGVEHAELYYQRGWLSMTTRQYGSAVADFEKAYKLSKDPRCLKGKGDALFHLGKYELAMQDYNHVIKTNPGDAATWANLGACYWALGNGKRAVVNYDKAVSLGLDMADRIRHTLTRQYEPGTYRIKPTARKVLPLC